MLTLALFFSYLAVAEPIGAWPDCRFCAGANSGPAAESVAADEHVRAAIASAIRQRMGADIDVIVDDLQIQVTPGTRLARSQNLQAGQAPVGKGPVEIVEAVPEPAARLDGNIRFILRWADTERSSTRVIRAGAAVARVRVTAEHAHTATLAARGVELGPNDVVSARHDIVAGPLRPWPTVADTIGSKTLRDLPPDACIARNAIAARPDVRTGEEVLAISRINGVVASAQMKAAESGDAGSVIRIVNQQSRRSLKARIVSPGLVEILK